MDRLSRTVIKPAVFFACFVPAGLMLVDFLLGRLAPEPVEAMLKITGLWALRLLLLTLAITPIRQRLRINFIRYRRMLGLYVFFYAFLHLLIYLCLEQSFAWLEILADVVERKFIFVGMLAFLLLLPLVVTSTRAMMKRLGRNWVRLHRSVYIIAGLAILHFFWLVKSDYTEPAIYGLLLFMLLLLRKRKSW